MPRRGFDNAVSVEIENLNKLADAREFLRQLTGQEYAQLNLLSERMPLSLPKPSDPEAWVNMALENNLKLRSAGFGVDQARENVRLQKAGHYPTLDLRANRVDLDNSVTDTTSSQVNLEVTIPLYSGGAVSSRSREAAYSYEASRQSLENLQRETVRTVRNAYRGQETAISQIKALDQTRVSTRSALEANQAGYEVGTRTIVDVLDAERNVYLAAGELCRRPLCLHRQLPGVAAGRRSVVGGGRSGNQWLAGRVPWPTSGEPVAPRPAKEPAKSGASKKKMNGKSAVASPAGREPAPSPGKPAQPAPAIKPLSIEPK